MPRSRSRRRRSTLPTLPEITLTPLIDTALTLLVIFMVTTPMINNSLKVELPHGQAREDQSQQQELVVCIDSAKRLSVNNDLATNFDDVVKKIKAKMGQHTNRTIFVKADQGVEYGYVIELVDHIKVVGGISYVALATKRA